MPRPGAPTDNADTGVPLDWSPDGSQIAFVGKDRRKIKIVDVRTGDVRVLIDGSIDGDKGYQWGTFSLDPKTGEVEFVTDEAGKVTGFVLRQGDRTTHAKRIGK